MRSHMQELSIQDSEPELSDYNYYVEWRAALKVELKNWSGNYSLL